MGNSESLIRDTAFKAIVTNGERSARETAKDTSAWLIDNLSIWSLTAGAAITIGACIFFIYVAFVLGKLLFDNVRAVVSHSIFGFILAAIVTVAVLAVEWGVIFWWGLK